MTGATKIERKFKSKKFKIILNTRVIRDVDETHFTVNFFFSIY